MNWNHGLKKLARANGVELRLFHDQAHKIGARKTGAPAREYFKIIGTGSTITEAREQARESLAAKKEEV